MDYSVLCGKVREIAMDAGRFIRSERTKLTFKDVETKSPASFVTYVDKESESMIVDALRKLIPGSGFVTEEGTAGNSGEELVWFIDPLDGTTNYIHGICPFSVSIGLTEAGKTVLGVVYELGQDEMFHATRGGRAFLNGTEIRVAESARSKDALIGTGFPYYAFDRIDRYLAVLHELMQCTQGLRRMGSAAADLSYVAAGRFDGFFEHALHAWDVAAGAFILQQAGGRVTDFNGGENWLFGGEIIAASEAYFPEFYSIVHKHLG
jgi:myo-inositol-1(or 4)-monophosphatase